MKDISFSLLLRSYHDYLADLTRDSETPADQLSHLLVLGETDHDIVQQWPMNHEKLEVLCTRFDIVQSVSKQSVTAHFNDLDFSLWPENSLDRVFYRISKERSAALKVINESLQRVRLGGHFVIAGGKQEGIKTYLHHIKKTFKVNIREKKQKGHSIALIEKLAPIEQTLDDRNYALLTPISELHQKPYYSKAGVFAAKKLDAGSRFLLEHLEAFLTRQNPPLYSALDLGCGHGHLSVALHYAVPDIFIQASDNNAAALLACEKNFSTHEVSGKVSASHGGNTLSGQFDIALCNPPFHQGFRVDGDLTQRFLSGVQQLLKPGGEALFVVNQFIPLESKAETLYSSVELLAEDGHFKLIILKR